MTDSRVVKSGKGQKISMTTYEQDLVEYENKIISRCPGCWGGCPDCLSPYPIPPNPEDYLDEGKK